MARAACCAAVAGAAVRGTAECRAGTISAKASFSTLSDSVCVYQNKEHGYGSYVE